VQYTEPSPAHPAKPLNPVRWAARIQGFITVPRITKDEAENAIMDRFVTAYEKMFGVQLLDIIHREKPDYSAFDPSRNILMGIEITGVYKNSEEAKIQYWEVDEWGPISGSSDDILASINISIRKKIKSAENYQFNGYLVLVIWNGSLVFNERFDMEFIKSGFVVPNNLFRDIWLIINNHNDRSPELFRIQ
jgi:hypothetical protein